MADNNSSPGSHLGSMCRVSPRETEGQCPPDQQLSSRWCLNDWNPIGGATAMQPVLLGLFRVLCSSLAASCLHAPISWSPDGGWLAYTVAEPVGSPALSSGFLYQEELPTTNGLAVGQAAERPSGGEFVRYRIWATERGSLASVLIEDSPHPLSSPAWGPDGHSLFYSRFVPEPAASRGNAIRGRYELVIQQALDRKRVIPLLSDLDRFIGRAQRVLESRWTVHRGRATGATTWSSGRLARARPGVQDNRAGQSSRLVA
jgi:WD40-like Beta Propeller Repeat